MFLPIIKIFFQTIFHCIHAGLIGQRVEKAWQTAIREVHEETGITLSEIWSADILEQFYEVDKECITLVPVFVSTVPTGTTVTLNDEHDAYEWVSFEKANTMLSFPGQQKALAAVKAEFVDKAPKPHLKIEIHV